MRKGTHDYDKAKIVVDIYHPQSDGRLVCSCYTPGAPLALETECLVKTVTTQELKDLLTNGYGKVEVFDSADSGYCMSFERYMELCSTQDITDYCSEIINKREGRTEYFIPSNARAHEQAAA